MKKLGEKPAFPQPICQNSFGIVSSISDIYDSQGGMTLRDWFAGMALSSMTIAPDYSKGPCNDALVKRAIIIADAMIAELEKKEQV